jgi:TRAP-type mannitol/chloroaromatic compound transport system permease large subunit
MPHTTDEKMWGARLVAVNAAGQLFIMHIEAQISLAAVGMALLAQSLIYQRKRFICLFEVTHIIWVPMLAWIALRLATLPEEEVAFKAWLVTLIATNAISLMIDTWDAARFVRGERQPRYVWR